MRSLMLVMLLVACGQQGTSGSSTDAASSNAITTSSKISPAKNSTVESTVKCGIEGAAACAVTIANGQFAQLVDAVTDLTCSSSNQGQLIYASSDKLFYTCDNSEWTAIDLKGAQGDQGVAGTDGNDGTNGKDGVSGTNGIDGTNGTTLLATYSNADWLNTNRLNNNSNQVLRSMTLAVYSDGSYSFTCEIFVSGFVYNPTFYVSAEKASTSLVKQIPLIGASYNDLSFQFPKGTDMVATAQSALSSDWDNGQTIQIGVALYTETGSPASSFQNFTVTGDY